MPIVDLPSPGVTASDPPQIDPNASGITTLPQPKAPAQQGEGGGQILPLPPESGRYNFQSLRDLLKHVDGSLPDKAYDDLSYVALAESTGDPTQVSQHGATGLWQILPSAHGKGNWSDPITNAKMAIELYKKNGLKDWEESRLKGAGGGWGQYVNRAGEGAGGKIVDLPGDTPSDGIKPLPKGGMAALLHPDVKQAGVGDVLQGLAPVAESYQKAVDQTEKAAHRITDTPRNIFSQAWDHYAGPMGYVTRPAQGLLNVLSTPQRMVDAYLDTQGKETTEGKPFATIDAIKDALHASIHPEDNDKIVDALERDFGKEFGFDTDGLQHSAWGKFAKVGLDIVVETATDPLTYVPIADAVTIPGRIARIAASNKVSYAAVNYVMTHLAQYPEMEKAVKALLGSATHAYTTGSNSFKITAGMVKNVFNTVFKDKRTELDRFFSPAGKNIYMATEGAVDHASTQLEKEHSAILDNDHQKIKINGGSADQQQADLATMFRYGGRTGRNRALNSGYVPTEMDKKVFGSQSKEYINYDATGTPLYKLPKGLSTPEAQSYAKDPDAFNVHLTGTNMLRAAARLGITPTQLAKQRFALAREALGRQQVAHKMADMVRSHPDLMHPGAASNAASLEEFMHTTVANSPDIAETFLKGGAKAVLSQQAYQAAGNAIKPLATQYMKVARAAQKIYTVGIKTNFAPHGMFNVGVITAARGGIATAARGLGYGVRLFAVDPLTKLAGHQSVDKLQTLINRNAANGGAGVSYAGGVFDMPDLLRDVPGLRTAMNLTGVPAYFKLMQHGLESFEQGYRAAYLEHLDHIMGPSSDVRAEMEKGAKVLADIGDYKNKTLMVKFLSGLGGLYTNFRASIAPSAIFNAIKHQGLLSSAKGMRTLPVTPLMLRAQHEMNKEQVAGPGFDEAMAGPIGDAAASLTPQYWKSPSTIGPIAAQVVQRGLEAAGKHPTPISPLEGVTGGLNAMGVPGFAPAYTEPRNVPDWLKTFNFLTGNYIQAKPGRSARRQERTFARMVNEE